MKVLALLPLLFLPFLPALVDDEPAAATAAPRWLDDLDLAVSLAAEGDRPLMIVFR